MQRAPRLEDPVTFLRAGILAFVLESSLALFLLRNFYALRERVLDSRRSGATDAPRIEPCRCAGRAPADRPRRC
jgi:hypothetical protein